MATRERKRLNRRTVVAIQVYSFLAGIFLMGEYGASKLWNKGITSSSYSEAVVALMAHYEGGGQ